MKRRARVIITYIAIIHTFGHKANVWWFWWWQECMLLVVNFFITWACHIKSTLCNASESLFCLHFFPSFVGILLSCEDNISWACLGEFHSQNNHSTPPLAVHFVWVFCSSTPPPLMGLQRLGLVHRLGLRQRLGLFSTCCSAWASSTTIAAALGLDRPCLGECCCCYWKKWGIDGPNLNMRGTPSTPTPENTHVTWSSL